MATDVCPVPPVRETVSQTVTSIRDTETVIETGTSLIELQGVVCLHLFTQARSDAEA